MLSQLEHRLIEILPFALIIMMFLIVRVIKLFTSHQQKMAEILNRSATDQTEMAGLRREIAELKSLVHDQVIRNDPPAVSVPTVPPTPDLAARLSSGS